ncbi:hypothetical protein [Tunicatimonas pelagia]|uniref:hypothetical protein n=1 Tax=Tunicatimonas pelagia TaxID=931531 RepID=UPI0026667426|nr:hypothetical protein [Tunicatimonas pelagia]WKN44243.1 hypothetical protein P0M28_04590 [Tunicatimonas pelagia]
MKRLAYIAIFTLFLCSPLFAQTDIPSDLKGSYKFVTNPGLGFDNQLEKGTVNSELIYKNGLITVVGYNEDEKMVYYRYWDFTDNTSPNAVRYNDKVFQLPLSDFKILTEKRYKRFKGVEAGAYTIPFRLRGIGGGGENNSSFDFESSLSLQANMVVGVGPRYQPESNFDFSLGVGITGVKLNEKNSSVTEERTASALTTSLGVVFKPVSNANIGLFMGFDFLGADDESVNWNYDGEMWIGLGINISFNKIQTTASPVALENK